MNSTSLARPTAGRMAAARNAYASDGRTTASPERLVVLLYQRLMRDLVEAEAAIERREIESSHHLLLHAQEIIDTLDLALDRDAWDGAEALGSLYTHLHDRLVIANVKKDAAIVAECRGMVEPLSDAWRDAWGSLAAGGA